MAISKNTHLQKVNNHMHARSDYSVTAKYQYTFKGKDYMGSRYSIADGDAIAGPFQKRLEASQWLSNSKYQPGAQITVYFDPDNPSESVIDNKIPWSAFVPFGVALLFGFLAMLVGMLEKRARSAARSS